MEPTGFFTLHVDSPEQGHISVRFGWRQGKPYLTDLGSSGQVLVNGKYLSGFPTIPLREIIDERKEGGKILGPFGEGNGLMPALPPSLYNWRREERYLRYKNQ